MSTPSAGPKHESRGVLSSSAPPLCDDWRISTKAEPIFTLSTTKRCKAAIAQRQGRRKDVGRKRRRTHPSQILLKYRKSNPAPYLWGAGPPDAGLSGADETGHKNHREGCLAENIVEIGRVGNGSKRSTLKVRVYLNTWTCFGGQAKEEPRLAHSLCWHRSAETRDDTLIQARG